MKECPIHCNVLNEAFDLSHIPSGRRGFTCHERWALHHAETRARPALEGGLTASYSDPCLCPYRPGHIAVRRDYALLTAGWFLLAHARCWLIPTGPCSLLADHNWSVLTALTDPDWAVPAAMGDYDKTILAAGWSWSLAPSGSCGPTPGLQIPIAKWFPSQRWLQLRPGMLILLNEMQIAIMFRNKK